MKEYTTTSMFIILLFCNNNIPLESIKYLKFLNWIPNSNEILYSYNRINIRAGLYFTEA